MSDHSAKAALRRQMRQRRRACRLDTGASARLVSEGLDLIAARRPKVIGLYQAIGGELSLDNLAAALTGHSLSLALPVVLGHNPPDMVFRLLTGQAVLVPDNAGILAPDPGSPAATPDLIFVPLLAVDRAGNRLGQGGGFYDRYLARRRQSGPPVYAAGVGFAAQLLDSLPADPYDQVLDAFLSEDGLMTF